jgi:hypothetical protein
MKGTYETLLSSVNASEWVKVGSKHYRHIKSGIQVKYDHNRWKWQVIGGIKCGNMYDVKWVAQMEGVKGYE